MAKRVSGRKGAKNEGCRKQARKGGKEGRREDRGLLPKAMQADVEVPVFPQARLGIMQRRRTPRCSGDG